MDRTRWGALALGLLVACGESSGGEGGAIESGQMGFLAGYCQVTLLTEASLDVWRATDTGWAVTSRQTIAAGTPLVLDSFRDEAYAFTSTGALRRLTRPDEEDFEVGTQVTKGCEFMVGRRRVLLDAVTLRETELGGGASCEVAAGEGFEGVEALTTTGTNGVSTRAGYSRFDGQAIQERCGFSPAHGGFVHHASFLPAKAPSPGD